MFEGGGKKVRIGGQDSRDPSGLIPLPEVPLNGHHTLVKATGSEGVEGSGGEIEGPFVTGRAAVSDNGLDVLSVLGVGDGTVRNRDEGQISPH